MAQIRFHATNERIEKETEVEAFLNSQGVIFEKWDITKLPEGLKETYLLSDEEKEQILETFAPEIFDISARRGYKAQDVISLTEATPNLDELLVNFKREHHHSDDEVRFIVSGHGIFAIEGENGTWFDVELYPGDLISVPENVRHYFTLQEDRQVVAIRIFVTTAGWVPIYEKEQFQA